MAHLLSNKTTRYLVPQISDDYQQRSLNQFSILPDKVNLVAKFLAFITIITFWWLATQWGLVNTTLLPSPQDVFWAAVSLWTQGGLSQTIALTFLRVSIAFMVAVIISLPLGIILGLEPRLQFWFSPLTVIFRYLLTVALMLLFIFYLEGNELTKIMLILFGMVSYNLLRITEVIKDVPRTLIDTTYTLGGNFQQIIFEVILPYAWPKIIEIFRLNVAIAWSLVMVTELLAAKIGLGQSLLADQPTLHSSQVMAYLLILGGLGLAIDLFFRWALGVTCEWSLE